jgi:hypothetical protein
MWCCLPAAHADAAAVAQTQAPAVVFLLLHRRDRVRHKVESLLQQQSIARHQQQRRQMMQQQQQAATRLAATRQQLLLQARAQLDAQRQYLLARCEGVVQAAGVSRMHIMHTSAHGCMKMMQATSALNFRGSKAGWWAYA